MNRDDIIRMAREAAGGMLSYDAEGEWRLNAVEVEQFAALVAAYEREACALVCEELDWPGNSDWQCGTMDCAIAIRERNEQ